MGREVWGTYSVTDHLAPTAFLADLVLYDRLVLPVPQATLDDSARLAWQEWNQPRQAAFVRVLERHQRVRTIPWEVGRWSREREAFAGELASRPGIDAEAARQAGQDAFLFTRQRLVMDLPPGVRGVTTVPTAQAEGPVARRLGFRLDGAGRPVPATQGVAAAVLGMRFLVPDLDRPVEPDDLERVLDHTGTSDHRRARRAFWAWQADFFGDDVIAGPEALAAAAEEMADLLSDLNRAAHWGQVRQRSTLAITVGSVALGMMAMPVTAVAAAGVGLTLLSYAVDRYIQDREPKRAPEAAVFAIGQTDLPFVPDGAV
jgi:hypothetical protein